MDNPKWGLCKACEWWQIEPEAKVANETLGLCIDEEIMPFQMRVSGNSGCKNFMPMKNGVARAAGSAAAPPTAKAVR
jgi:hypothetical protein